MDSCQKWGIASMCFGTASLVFAFLTVRINQKTRRILEETRNKKTKWTIPS